jgi:hypothetical protein
MVGAAISRELIPATIQEKGPTVTRDSSLQVNGEAHEVFKGPARHLA